MARPALRQARPPAGGTGAEVRLALLERVLDANDLAGCAADVVTWLGQHAGLRRALVAVMDDDGERLVGAAGVGLRPEAVEAFQVDLADEEHPLAPLVASPGPVHFERLRGPGRPSRSPLDPGPFSAIPVGPGGAWVRLRTGVLLVGASAPAAFGDALWVADVLGRRFARPGGEDGRSDDRRVRHRRRMLEILVNAVPDPVVLTDGDGRIRVANARAEELFAAAEDASDGRRRAVLMNNTFFSAALSRGAVENAPID